MKVLCACVCVCKAVCDIFICFADFIFIVHFFFLKERPYSCWSCDVAMCSYLHCLCTVEFFCLMLTKAAKAEAEAEATKQNGENCIVFWFGYIYLRFVDGKVNLFYSCKHLICDYIYDLHAVLTVLKHYTTQS